MYSTIYKPLNHDTISYFFKLAKLSMKLVDKSHLSPLQN